MMISYDFHRSFLVMRAKKEGGESNVKAHLSSKALRS